MDLPECHPHIVSQFTVEHEFVKHLVDNHPARTNDIEASGGNDRWQQFMLAEAYWLGMSVPHSSLVRYSNLTTIYRQADVATSSHDTSPDALSRLDPTSESRPEAQR